MLNNFLKYIMFFAFIFKVNVATSQVDSIAMIDSIALVEVTSSKKEWAETGKTFDGVLFLQKENVENEVSSVLLNKSNIYIKNYGLNNLSTSSIRGMGAVHTVVTLNGHKIQSPMNGLVDFSLIPTYFIDQISISYNGSSAAYGNNAIGGGVHLQTNDAFLEQTSDFFASASVQMGSFGHYGQYGTLKWKWNKQKMFYGQIKMFNEVAKNDFIYQNIAQFGKPKVRQQNAAMQQYALLQENKLIWKNNVLNSSIWLQKSYRQLPASMTEGASTASQDDKLIRIGANWLKQAKNNSFKAAFMFNNEVIYYKNEAINSNNDVKWFNGEVEWFFQLKENQKLIANIQNSYAFSNADNYESIKRQNLFDAFLTYQHDFTRIDVKVVANVRQSKLREHLPFTYSLGIEKKWHEKYTTKLHTSKNFRVPTLNDLYWVSLGNDQLKPETAYSIELGQSLNFSEKINLKGGLFMNYVTNWILWTPQQGGVWKPNNLQKVWSRGLQMKLNGAFYIKTRENKINYELNYDYTKSTNEEKISNYQKQLIYTPLHSSNINIYYQYKDLGISYHHNFRGKVFTTTDNTAHLPSYDVASMSFWKKCRLKKDIGLILKGSIENLYGEVYQIIEWRQMPTTYFKMNVTIEFDKKRKSL